MKDEKTIPAFRACLQEHNEELAPGTKLWLINALGETPHRDSVPALAALLTDRTRTGRRQAAWALQQIRAPESQVALQSAVYELSWFGGRWARRALRARQRLDDVG